MNSTSTTDLIEALTELRRLYPQWRLGQLIANIAGWGNQDAWDIEDDILLTAAREHIQAAVKIEAEVCS